MASPAAPEVPSGLWRNTEDGMVMRIAPCGTGFCGVAVGTPTSPGRTPPRDACGATILRDFVWRDRSRRWEGSVQPPDIARELSGQLTVAQNRDGTATMSLRARVLLLTKTMTFVPFSGRIGDNCRVE
jgi:uncharacterized protein (DUF2147 family)